MSALYDRLKAEYPDKGFEQDPLTGLITFVHDGTCIRDPFESECGRFRASPSDYGLDLEDGIALFDHNLGVPSEFEE